MAGMRSGAADGSLAGLSIWPGIEGLTASQLVIASIAGSLDLARVGEAGSDTAAVAGVGLDAGDKAVASVDWAERRRARRSFVGVKKELKDGDMEGRLRRVALPVDWRLEMLGMDLGKEEQGYRRGRASTSTTLKGKRWTHSLRLIPSSVILRGSLSMMIQSWSLFSLWVSGVGVDERAGVEMRVDRGGKVGRGLG